MLGGGPFTIVGLPRRLAILASSPVIGAILCGSSGAAALCLQLACCALLLSQPPVLLVVAPRVLQIPGGSHRGMGRIAWQRGLSHGLICSLPSALAPVCRRYARVCWDWECCMI